jgi:hypothetical protein
LSVLPHKHCRLELSLYIFLRAERLYNYSQRPVANEGVSKISRDLLQKPKVDPNGFDNFLGVRTASWREQQTYPIFCRNRVPRFSQTTFVLSHRFDIGDCATIRWKLHTHWLHTTHICSVGQHPLRAKHSPNSGEPVLHENPDL